MVLATATTTTLSLLVPISMLTIQEASGTKEKCNNNDNNDDNTTTCSNQQKQDPKNHGSLNSNTKNSFPFRLPMPFP